MMDLIAASLGFVSLAAAVGIPFLLSSEDLGGNLTRFTVRLALVYYAAALTMMLLMQPAQWQARDVSGRLTRWLWTWAWLIFVVHVACAFHFFHHWSHAEAVRHTAEVSGFGPGIYASCFFTVLWGMDLAAWWWRPGWYAGRSSWIDYLLHGFMLFMVFNATVVFESGGTRWAGLVLFTELAAVFLLRSQLSRRKPEPAV